MKLHLLATAILLTFTTGSLSAADKKDAAKWDINNFHKGAKSISFSTDEGTCSIWMSAPTAIQLPSR